MLEHVTAAVNPDKVPPMPVTFCVVGPGLQAEAKAATVLIGIAAIALSVADPPVQFIVTVPDPASVPMRKYVEPPVV